MKNIEGLYNIRFNETERLAKERIWKVLCEEYFQEFVEENGTLLEIACGYGEFSRYTHAKKKIAVDINPAVQRYLPAEVQLFVGRADALDTIVNESVDTCFASNFFEHLDSKNTMDLVLMEIYRVLKPGGRFIMMQPNIKYAGKAYWDFYDHQLPLSHLSAAEGLGKNGFSIELIVPKLVPYSSKSRYPQHPLLVKAYLKLPFLWKLLGKQFVIVARKPVEASNHGVDHDF